MFSPRTDSSFRLTVILQPVPSLAKADVSSLMVPFIIGVWSKHKNYAASSDFVRSVNTTMLETTYRCRGTLLLPQNTPQPQRRSMPTDGKLQPFSTPIIRNTPSSHCIPFHPIGICNFQRPTLSQSSDIMTPLISGHNLRVSQPLSTSFSVTAFLPILRLTRLKSRELA